MNNLAEKLKKEKFKGKKINWRNAKWGEVNVDYAMDNKNWYYLHGNAIYVQAKNGDHTPHCYACGSEIKFGAQDNSVWHGEFDGPIGSGEVKTIHIPYCPRCEKIPEKANISIE